MNTYYFFIICALVFSSSVNAITKGSGEINLALSKNNTDEFYGAAGRYNINEQGSNFSTFLATDFQVGSNEGRSAAATSAHQFQYVRSFVQLNGGSEFSFNSQYLRWNNNFSYRKDFKQTDVDDKINTDFDKTKSMWGITIGPSFTYGKGSSIRVRSNVFVSQQDDSEIKSNEIESSIGLGKPLSKFSFIFADVAKVCTKYKQTELKNNCREDYTLSFASKRKYYVFGVGAGVSKDESITTNIYKLDVEYTLNTASKIDLLIYKSINKISDLSDNEFTENTFDSQVSTGQSLSYQYSWGRKRLTLNARYYEGKVGKNTSNKLDSVIYYEYDMGRMLCGYCQLEMNHEYSKSNTLNNKKISTVGLRRNNSKYWSSKLEFRKTTEDTKDNLWSINLLITYNGQVTKFGY